MNNDVLVWKSLEEFGRVWKSLEEFGRDWKIRVWLGRRGVGFG